MGLGQAMGAARTVFQRTCLGRRALIGLTAVLLMAGSGAAPLTAGTVSLWGRLGGPAQIKVVSLKEARFKTVLQQRYDFSCGSAALATLLTYHYAHPIAELEVFTAMLAAGDADRIRTYGFSLLDMKRFLTAHGYRSDGYRVGLDRFKAAGVPGIVLLNTKGYRHFVVIKGLSDDAVVIGDPARGVRVIKRADFETMWNGIVFVLRTDVAEGRRHFNQAADWHARPKAPFGAILSRRDLAAFTVQLTNPVTSF